MTALFTISLCFPRTIGLKSISKRVNSSGCDENCTWVCLAQLNVHGGNPPTTNQIYDILARKGVDRATFDKELTFGQLKDMLNILLEEYIPDEKAKYIQPKKEDKITSLAQVTNRHGDRVPTGNWVIVVLRDEAGNKHAVLGYYDTYSHVFRDYQSNPYGEDYTIPAQDPMHIVGVMWHGPK